MTKYTFTSECNGSGDKVEITTYEVCLDDLNDAYQRFLLANGFSLKGNIEVVDE